MFGTNDLQARACLCISSLAYKHLAVAQLHFSYVQNRNYNTEYTIHAAWRLFIYNIYIQGFIYTHIIDIYYKFKCNQPSQLC